MVSRRAFTLAAVSAALVAAATVAPAVQATPVCTALPRQVCGGRIIPEPMQTAGFLTYSDLLQSLVAIQQQHPGRVRVVQIGKSAGGQPVIDVIVSDFLEHLSLSRRTGLFFNGSIHGDERDGAEGFARVIEDLAETTDPAKAALLEREVLVFTFANPDGWVHGDVPGGLEQAPGPADGGAGPGAFFYTRWNDASHDLNREWPVVGYQNETTFPLVDPEVRASVSFNGDYLHRTLGVDFAYAFDVHGSSAPRTPPQSQLMLDILMGADQMDLRRTTDQTRLLTAYIDRLGATAAADPLHSLGASSGGAVYTPGEWDTTWDIYGYQVSGDYADWMASSVTGLGGRRIINKLWANGEPRQENSLVGYDPLVEASNVQSLRVLAATAMDQAVHPMRARLHLPGPIAYVANRTLVTRHSGHGSTKPIGSASVRPPVAHYPASTNRFFADLARVSDAAVVRLDDGDVDSTRTLARFRAVVVAQDAHLDSPRLLSALRGYARAGGVVVLTDAALRDLSALHLVPRSAVHESKVYAGYVTPSRAGDPMTRGARALSNQTYEPVPLGYALSNTFSSATSVNTAPAWSVSTSAWQEAGGRSAGTTGSGNTSLGDLRLGRGHVRIIGSLLPDATGAYSHPFGLASYALTYWGYQILENALGATVR